jgi:hypothetical protein
MRGAPAAAAGVSKGTLFCARPSGALTARRESRRLITAYANAEKNFTITNTEELATLRAEGGGVGCSALGGWAAPALQERGTLPRVRIHDRLLSSS